MVSYSLSEADNGDKISWFQKHFTTRLIRQILHTYFAIASFRLNYFSWPNYVAPLQSCQIHWECATDLATVQASLGYLNS